MAVKIRGTQILDGTITATSFVTGLNLPTSQLAEGANFLKRDGTVAMTASLNMGSQRINSLAEPTSLQDAATKNYVDTRETSIRNDTFRKDGSIAATGAFNLGGFKVTNLAEPTAASDAATKNYVDLAIQGLRVKDSVKAATTTNITLSGTQTIDSVPLSIGDRVLVKDQTTPTENGLYVVASGAWTRTSDADTGSELRGAFTFVQQGVNYADTGWVMTTDVNVVVGTTAINWIQFSSAGQIIAGSGLGKSGNFLYIQLDTNSGLSVSSAGLKHAFSGSTITADASGLKLNTAVGSNLASATVLLGNASGVATATTLSGDATISNTGVVTVNAIKPANFITSESPSGNRDGVNATFTLSNTPIPNSERLYYNGVRLIRGVGEDYTISGATITMLSYIPLSGDKLVVDYVR